MKNRLITISTAVMLAVLLSAYGNNLGNITEKDTDVLSTDANEAMMNEAQTNTYRQISMAEAVSMIHEESDYIIFNVRRPNEFTEGHIPNAINVPNETIGTAEISELPDKEQLIMVYCRNGHRSKEAMEKLVKLGYTNISWSLVASLIGLARLKREVAIAQLTEY